MLENSIERLYAPDISAIDALTTHACVQIMTIHKSKGLEFDTVIVPGLDRIGPSDDKPLLSWNEHLFADGSAGLVLCPLDALGSSEQNAMARLAGESDGLEGKKSASDLYQFLRDENKRVSTFESTRLLYVAATRAKSKLLLLANLELLDDDGSNIVDPSAVKVPSANSLLSRLWPSVAGEAKICCSDESVLDDDSQADGPVYPLLKRIKLTALQAISSQRENQTRQLG